jgi:hypothetical protein
MAGLLAVVGAGCGGMASGDPEATATRVTRGPPAQPGQLVTGFSESQGQGRGADLYVRNNTDRPVTITSLTLFECENVSGGCGTREMAVVLGPAQVLRLAQVVPAIRDRGWRYRWRWTHTPGVVASARPGIREDPGAFVLLESSEQADVLLDPRGRFLNVVVPDSVMTALRAGRWTGTRFQFLSPLVYRSLEDAFDFLVFAFPDDAPVESPGGFATRTRQHTRGLGLAPGDRTDPHGSAGRLKGVLMLGRHAWFDSGLALHELAHLWGQRVVPWEDPEGHWRFAGVGGYLGGWAPGTLEAVGSPGLWRAQGPGEGAVSFQLNGVGRAQIPYPPLELYLMGLLPPDSVPPFQVAEDAEWVNQELGLFRAAELRTVTVEELVATHGPREPAYPDAPRSFRGAYVVVTTEPLGVEERNRVDGDVADFARPGPPRYRGFLNFWEATEGRGRLVMDGLTEVVRSHREPEGGPAGR